MSKADKMFEELGYEITNAEEDTGCIKEDGKEFILFISKKQSICIHKDNTEYPAFTMQELQAINEKCKELGWL